MDGLTTSVSAFKRELERRGHELHVFATGDSWRRDAHETRYKGHPWPTYPDLLVNYWPLGHDTRALLAEGDFDVVHCQSPGVVAAVGELAARRLGLPVVMSFHTFLPDLVQYVVPRALDAPARAIVWAAVRRFFVASDLVLVPGASTLAEIRRHVSEADQADILVQPNGVDIARFAPSARSGALAERLGIGDAPLVVSVGRLAREKDLPFVVRAFERARRDEPDLVLAIGGRGPERDAIEREARRLDVAGAVHFLGFVPPVDLAATYASADAFVSASAFETQGMTALEALACGTPVAAAHARGLADYVHEGAGGFLFPPGDVEAAASAILSAVRAPEATRRAARASVLPLSLENATDLLEKRYAVVAGSKPRGR